MSGPGQKAMRAVADAKKILRDAGARGDTLVDLATNIAYQKARADGRVAELTRELDLAKTFGAGP
jgi:hypothetical protein